MDIRIWFKNNTWILVLIIHIAYLSYNIWDKGWSTYLATSTGLSLAIVSLTTFLANSNTIFKWSRKIYLEFGKITFNWDTKARYTIRQSSLLANLNESLESIIREVLKDHKIKVSPGDISFAKEKSGFPSIYIGPVALHLLIDITDAEMSDKDGFALSYLTLRIRTSLRYKDMRKKVTGVIIDLLIALEKRLKPQDEQYNIKIKIEGSDENYYKDQFIKEFKPSEIDHFTITVKNNPQSIQQISNRDISINSSRREDLIEAVTNLLHRMS